MTKDEAVENIAKLFNVLFSQGKAEVTPASYSALQESWNVIEQCLQQSSVILEPIPNGKDNTSTSSSVK